MADEYDYVIVGAGSAGCVLADRLSRSANNRVLVLEAGERSESPLITMPKGMGRLVTDPQQCWQYRIDQPREPGVEPNEFWVRGRGLGGSSLVNGMIYIRGHPQDYEHWRALGATGWGWSDMQRAFRAIEDHELGDDGNRGVGGPVHVSTGKFRYPLSEKMIQAGQQMGLPYLEDLNAEDHEGVGYYPHNIKKGRRQSAYHVFLKPAMRRPNLRVVTGANVDRILFEGRRARQVVAIVEGRETRFAVRGEVVLCAGTLMSPAVLQRSGVGAAADLQALGIEPVVDSPDVGRRMLEHVNLSIPHRLKRGQGNNRRFHGAGLALSVLQYYLRRSGPLATGPYEVGAFVRTDPQLPRPDAQLYLSAFTFDRAVAKGNFAIQLNRVEKEPGMTIASQLVATTSEGTIRISGSSPDAPLSIEPNWMTTEKDRRALVDVVKLMRKYVRQPALAPYVGEELVLGASAVTDEDIFRQAFRLIRSGTHGVATCRMGGDDRAVVDSQARVREVEGLRVVDCSIMPGHISGNTNAPAMAVGWRAADLILAS